MSEQIVDVNFDLRDLKSIGVLRQKLTTTRNWLQTELDRRNPYLEGSESDQTVQGLVEQEKAVLQLVYVALEALDGIASGKSQQIDDAMKAFAAAEDSIHELVDANAALIAGGRRS